MYFEQDAVQVDLDSSYLSAPKTAQAHAQELLESMAMQADFITPKQYTASTLPDIPTKYEFMCCPRSISDLSSKIGLGHIGAKVRRILHSAQFPVLITSAVYKPWESISILFGGSQNAVKALRLGLALGKRAGIPVDIFTHAPGHSQGDYRETLEKRGLIRTVDSQVRSWQFMTTGTFQENLWNIPHNALLVLGAYGHGLIKDLLFGNTMEAVQNTMPNNMLIAGPRFKMPL
jgi:nucleotide-binding universal stress UspA family protein